MTTESPSPDLLPLDAFWALIADAGARAASEPEFADRLTELLTGRSRDEVVAFERRFTALHDALYRWDVWAAGYLIGGGCSDDAFIDFRTGVIALGRDRYERVLASPDSLAGLPGEPEELEDLFDEAANYAATRAFEAVHGNEEEWHELLSARHPAAPHEPVGEDFDFDDDEEMRRRLPGLAALFL
ncbi:DUF4240 domain-containing protein [Kitasatospora sp. NPDC008115]|uniref:DUF4240 domain-containing protein n=1 Tax=Kitasatospora sp. NPDC008115 TaxID=3364022 RepID=UPI0036F0C3E4